MSEHADKGQEKVDCRKIYASCVLLFIVDRVCFDFFKFVSLLRCTDVFQFYATKLCMARIINV